MKRRDFLTAGAAVVGAGFLQKENAVQANETPAELRELIEVRILYAQSEDAKKRLLDRCGKILIPAHRQLGFRKTGILSLDRSLHADDKSLDPIYENAVFLITSAPNFEKLEAFHELLHTVTDADRRIQTYAENALYSEMESSLLRAFPHCPVLEVPTLSPNRILQFRRYFSPSCNRNRAKRSMFDVRGELDLFRRCGMAPVFFGEMLYGPVMPNVSYMLSFEDDEARQTGWQKFKTSDEWNTMKVEPEFKETATRIRNLFLRPTPESEI